MHALLDERMKKVLFVCLGNICRSPAAEAIFIGLIKDKGLGKEYIVDSAGTGGWHAGNKADERMINAASKRGIEINSIARQIELDDFHKFDLILTMDNNNQKTILDLLKKNGLKSGAKIKKILSYSSNSKCTEVPDPYYGGENGFEDVLDLLTDACQGILDNSN